MESLWRRRVPPTGRGFLRFRGISDYADDTKNDAWHEYAAATAAAFVFGLIHSGCMARRPAQSMAGISRAGVIAIRHQSMDPITPQAIADVLPQDLRGAAVEELVVDQTDLCVQGRMSDPLQAVGRQLYLHALIMDRLTSDRTRHVAYYGIAHIPLLVLAGYQLSNKYHIQFFDLNSISGGWYLLQGEPTFPELRINGLPECVDNRSGDVALRISVSFPIALEDISVIVPAPVSSIHVALAAPQRDIVTSERQLAAYAQTCRRVLDEIHNRLPNAQRIHVFYAGPVPLAVSLGRLISKTIQPSIIVYNYCMKDNPHYSWGLDITRFPACADMLVIPRVLRKEV